MVFKPGAAGWQAETDQLTCGVQIFCYAFNYAGLPSANVVKSKIRKGEVAKHPLNLFHAYIRSSNGEKCGGALLTSNYVLTAAHCVQQEADYWVTLGKQSTIYGKSAEVTFGITHIEIHPNYTFVEGTQDNFFING